MPYEDLLLFARQHATRACDGAHTDASSVDLDASDHTVHAEDTRLPVNLQEEDLHTAVTAPLLSHAALDSHRYSSDTNSNVARTHANSSGPRSRALSPQPRSLSPCTNASVCVPHPHHLQRWSQYLGEHRDATDVESVDRGSTSDLYSVRSRRTTTTPEAEGARHVDNVSFASEVGARTSGFHSSSNNNSRRAAHMDAAVGSDGEAVYEDSPQSPTTTIQAERPSSRGVLRRLLSIITPSITAFRERLHNMTWKRILWVIFLVALVMIGNFMQIVMLNFWLISFPSDGTPGNYTAFAVPGIFFAILFALLFGAYAVIRRPSLRFATHLHGWGILLGVGFCDALNSWMATYAASNTSEVLQALFTNLCPLFAVFLSKWILHDTRRYANIYIASVFILTICGILAASLYGLIKDHNMSEGRWWILIFFLSMPVRVLMNVFQSLYMIVYTRDSKFVSWLRVRFAEEEEEETPTVADAAKHAAATTAKEPDDVDQQETHMSCHDVSKVHLKANADVDDCADALAAAGEPESDPSLPVIMITSPTSAAVDPPPSQQQRQQTQSVCFDGVYKPPVVQKPSPKEPQQLSITVVDAGDDVVATPADEPAPPPVANPGSDNAATATAADIHESTFDVGGEEEEDILSPAAAAAPPLPTQTMFTVRYNQGEDTIVKLVMLAGETFIQMCFTLSLLPADALPWWGNSDTVAATWENFKEGIRCVFTIQENFLYCFLYTLGFIFTYVSCAYLNHYSAALCSIVSQLSSPVTALMLVIVPSWNVQEDGDSPWYCNVVAIFFLCIAALLYVLWEEMTDHEKVQTEYTLKMEQLHVRPSSHEKPHSVVIDG